MIFPWGLRITPVDHVADQMDSVHTDSWSVRKEHKNDMCWKGCSGSDLHFQVIFSGSFLAAAHLT